MNKQRKWCPIALRYLGWVVMILRYRGVSVLETARIEADIMGEAETFHRTGEVGVSDLIAAADHRLRLEGHGSIRLSGAVS